jgi:ABC-type sugar transport system ATPase subunit
MNVVQADVADHGVVFGQFRLSLTAKQTSAIGERRKVIVGLRPEAFSIGESHSVNVDVAAVENLGTESHVFFGIDAAAVGVAAHKLVDDEQSIVADRTVFIAKLSPDHDINAGQTLALTADANKLYLFDATTGDALS